MKLSVRTILAVAAATAALAVQAQMPVRIGFITTLSTPAGYIGEDLRDGFQLAVKQGAASSAACQSSS